jgi:hypothetical protein
MTLFLLVILYTWVDSSQDGRVMNPTVVAQFVERHDCEAYRASLTGSTREHEHLVCVPATSLVNP